MHATPARPTPTHGTSVPSELQFPSSIQNCPHFSPFPPVFTHFSSGAFTNAPLPPNSLVADQKHVFWPFQPQIPQFSIEHPKFSTLSPHFPPFFLNQPISDKRMATFRKRVFLRPARVLIVEGNRSTSGLTTSYSTAAWSGRTTESPRCARHVRRFATGPQLPGRTLPCMLLGEGPSAAELQQRVGVCALVGGGGGDRGGPGVEARPVPLVRDDRVVARAAAGDPGVRAARGAEGLGHPHQLHHARQGAAVQALPGVAVPLHERRARRRVPARGGAGVDAGGRGQERAVLPQVVHHLRRRGAGMH